MSETNIHLALPAAAIERIKKAFAADFPEAYDACSNLDPQKHIPARAMYAAYKMGFLRGGEIR